MARLDDELVKVFAAHEAKLVPYLIPLTVAGVSRAMGVWLTRARPEPTEPQEPERTLHLSRTLEDRFVLDGTLDPEGGAVVSTALRLATADRSDAPRHPAARRADALVDICRFFLDHQQAHPGGRHRPHVNVVVELEDLLAGRGAQVVDGPMLDGPTVSRLFCDSAVHRVVMSGRSSILDYGTSSRRVDHRRRNHRSRQPRPACSRHHHALHQPGWHTKLRPDGAFEVTDTNGIARETSPPRAEFW